MSKLLTQWESTQPNPDEKYLKAIWEDEVNSMEKAFAEEAAEAKRRQTSIMPLVKAAGLNQQEITLRLKELDSLSKKTITLSAQQVSVPPAVDFGQLEKMDLELVKNIEKKSKELKSTTYQGYVTKASYGGYWYVYNGEAEEKPSTSFTVSQNRFDPKAQSYGEGWYDVDYSKINVYLAFVFNSPAWGQLEIKTYPWLHGYYSLYSNDDWYNSGHARAEVDTWVDVCQNYTRPRQSYRRFTMAGYELHPTRSGRIDTQYGHSYYTDIGENDTVTVRVGVQLYCRVSASGSHSILNFNAGSANYVYVPYIYWRIYT